jgi:hypothetical protein
LPAGKFVPLQSCKYFPVLKFGRDLVLLPFRMLRDETLELCVRNLGAVEIKRRRSSRDASATPPRITLHAFTPNFSMRIGTSAGSVPHFVCRPRNRRHVCRSLRSLRSRKDKAQGQDQAEFQYSLHWLSSSATRQMNPQPPPELAHSEHQLVTALVQRNVDNIVFRIYDPEESRVTEILCAAPAVEILPFTKTLTSSL